MTLEDLSNVVNRLSEKIADLEIELDIVKERVADLEWENRELRSDINYLQDDMIEHEHE